MQFFKKLWKIKKNIEIFNLSQQEEEEIIQYQNQIIILQISHRKSITNRNEKTEILMNKPVYLELSILKLSKI